MRDFWLADYWFCGGTAMLACPTRLVGKGRRKSGMVNPESAEWLPAGGRWRKGQRGAPQTARPVMPLPIKTGQCDAGMGVSEPYCSPIE